MSNSEVFDRTVDILSAALTYTHNQGVQNRPKPERSDAVRLTWQLVDLVMDEVRRGSGS